MKSSMSFFLERNVGGQFSVFSIEGSLHWFPTPNFYLSNFALEWKLDPRSGGCSLRVQEAEIRILPIIDERQIQTKKKQDLWRKTKTFTDLFESKQFQCRIKLQ